MGVEHVSVKCTVDKTSEEIFFQKQEQKLIKKIREEAGQQGNQKYQEEHRNHCFRCGTPSLVDCDRGGVKIDICVNEGCGAVHLDPGELDAIIKDRSVIKDVRSAIFSVFK